MKAARHAAACMFEDASVVAAKMSVIVDRHAMGVISAVIVENHAAAPVRGPSAPTPAVVRKESYRDSHREANSQSQNQAGRRRQHVISRVGDEQPSPHPPRIVVRNVNQSRIHRRDQDLAIVCIYPLLRR